MLIVEGTDLVGKTTLCHELVKRLNSSDGEIVPRAYTYSHLSALPEDWEYYWSYLPLMHRHVVQDRFYLSEIVYGDVVRGHTFIDEGTWRLLDAHLRLMGAFTIVVIGDESAIREKYKDHETREMFSLDKILRVNDRFNDLAYAPSNDVDQIMHVGTEVSWPSTQDKILEIILKRYEKRQARIDHLLRGKERHGTL